MRSPDPSVPTPERPPQAGRWPSAVFSLVAILALLTLAGWLLWSQAPRMREQNPRDHQAVGKKLPALELQPLTGADTPVTLDDLKGRVALIDFWGTWCGPCKLEMPHLVRVAKTFATKPDFQFLAVSCGQGPQEDLDELRAETEVYLERAKLAIPAYADLQMVTRNAFDSVGQLQGYPTTFLLDRQGVIRYVWLGAQPGIEEQLQAIIPELLEEK
jgi:thiol-disulfide isomerase/thioredoxin